MILDSEIIKGENGLEIKVAIRENILTDDTPEEPSRTYDVETHFYDLASVAPVMSLVDHSACSKEEALKKYRDVYFSLCSLKESEII
jgi:hypothetical protein